MAAFVIVHAGSYGGLKKTSFNISKYKKNTAAINILLLAGLFIWVLGSEKLRQGISTKVKVAHAYRLLNTSKYNRVQEKFFATVTRYDVISSRWSSHF